MTDEPLKDYSHKTVGRVIAASNYHDINECSSNERKDCIEQIEAAKYLFRDHLEGVIEGRFSHPFSPEEFGIKVLEAYRRSDFDWRDVEKFREFDNWARENLRNLT